MNAIGKHIENAIAAGRVKNPAEIARRLDIQRSTVTRWIDGSSAPSAKEARALAALLHLQEGVLMAECEAERAKDEETRAAWLRVARFLGKEASTAALTVLAAVTLFVSAHENAIAKSGDYAQAIDHNTNYRHTAVS